MELDLAELLLRIGSGGIAGYTANLLVINMLFRKYPVIGGEVISNNESQLKNSVKDFIGNGFINKIFENNSTKEKFSDLIISSIDTILKESIPEQLSETTISQLPDSDKIFLNIENILKNYDISSHLNPEILLKEISLEKILGSEQLSIFSNKAYSIIMKTVNPEIKNFLTAIYDDFKEKKVLDLLEEKNLNKISDNVSNFIEHLRPRIIEVDAEIDTLLNNSLKAIDINELFDNLENIIKDKRIIDLIGEENKSRVSNELISHFIVFIDSDEGQNFLKKLSANLINLSKNIDQSLLSFLNPTLQIKMFNFIDSNLAYLVDTAKEWLRINKKEIEAIIENTIEEYYSQNQGFRNQLKLKIKDLIGLKITEYFQVVEKGIARLENYITNSASKDLTEEIITFLHSKEIGTIFNQLNINVDKLANFFHKIIHQYLPKINTSLFDSIFYKRLGDISAMSNLSIKDKFGEQINNFLIKQIKYQTIYNDKLFNQAGVLIKDKIESFKSDNFEAILSKEKFENYIGYLPIFLMFSQGKIIEKILAEVKRQVSDKNINDIVPENIKGIITKNINNLYDKHYKLLVTNFKDLKIRDIYEKGINNYSINQELINNFESLFEKCLTDIFIHKTENINSQQLSNRLKQFINPEKNSMRWSAAFLGTGVGTLSYFIPNINHSDLIITPIIYSGLGIGVNYLAIRSIFQPYQKKIISGLKIPFTPGIIPKNRELIYSDISKYYSENINGSVNDIFNNDLKAKVKNSISVTNIDNFISTITNNINIDYSSATSSQIISLIEENKHNIVENVINEIDHFEIKQINQDTFNKTFSDIIDGTKSFVANFINTKLESYRQQNIGQIVPDKIKNEINEYIAKQLPEKITSYSNLLQDNKIENTITETLSQFDAYLNLNVKIDSLMDIDKSNYLKNKTTNYLDNLLQEKISDAIKKYIHHFFLEDQLSPDKRISSLFNGELVNFARKNINKGLDKVIFEIGLEKLKTEKEYISDKIISKVREANKDSFLYSIGESVLNIEEDIKNIIYLLIDDKLEPYLSTKKWELENILAGFVDFLARKKLEEIGFTEDLLDSENIEELINKFIANKNIIENINHLSVALINDVSSLDLSFIFGLFGISSLSNISDKFSKDISLIKASLLDKINTNHEIISKESSNIISQSIDKIIYHQSFQPVLENINSEDISDITNNIIEQLYKSESLIQYKTKFAEGIYQTLSEKKGGEILDIVILEKEINDLFNTVTDSEELNCILEKSISPILNHVIKNSSILITDNTKDFFAQIVSESVIKVFSNDFEKLVDTFALKNIILDELNKLSPETLKDIIYPDNKDARNLVLSGWLTGLLGVIVSLL